MMNTTTRRITLSVCTALVMVATEAQVHAQSEACCLPNGTCQTIDVNDCLARAGRPQAVPNCSGISCKPHIVLGVCGGEPMSPDDMACPDGDGSSLKLFAAEGIQGIAGDGPGVYGGNIIPVRRIDPSSSSGANLFKLPDIGGYSFGTRSLADIGTDYAAAPYFPALSKLPNPTFSFETYTRRLSYSDPAEFAYYSVFGQPLMIHDNDEAFFGDQGDAHFHPFWLMRRPGLASWTFQYTSNTDFVDSDPITNYWTSVPGRGEFVPIDISSAFNADLVDSDAMDSPISFDGAGHYWLLDGLYGTNHGLPTDGILDEFQLGGPDGTSLFGSAANAVFDNGVLSTSATIDLMATGQDDQYLSVEFLIGGAGNFTTSDTLNVTLEYADGTMQSVPIKRRSSALWLDYRMLDNWQQTAMPKPILAIGPNGDNNTGFSRSTGSGIDTTAGNNSYLFRATTPAFVNKTLNAIRFGDYTGGNRVAVFAALGIKKAPLEIVTDSLPPATEGQPYSQFIDALGTPPFKNWSVSGLPTGLMFEVATGEIFGTPDPGTAVGSPYSVTISVEDSINDFDANFPPESAMTTLSLTVGTGDQLGDIDNDGDLDQIDIQLFSAVLTRNIGPGDHPTAFDRSDINGDGQRDGNDVAPLIAAFGI